MKKVFLREWETVGTRNLAEKGNRSCRYFKNHQKWALMSKKYHLMVFSLSYYNPTLRLLCVMTRHNRPFSHDLTYMMSYIGRKQAETSDKTSWTYAESAP